MVRVRARVEQWCTLGCPVDAAVWASVVAWAALVGMEVTFDVGMEVTFHQGELPSGLGGGE